MITKEQFLWVEKYRPKTIEDCVLPDDVKNIFLGFLKQGKIPNLLLSGPPGTGKTTIAKALCSQLGHDVLVINSSLQNGIDVLRTTIQSFASTMSLTQKRKVVILDEADYLTAATQPALRNFIEEFSKNCSFILTCNFKNRIIEPLHSRCSLIEFRITKENKVDISEKFYKRLLNILDTEKVTYSKKVVAELMMKNFPDFRRVINELQKYAAATGEINEGILAKVHNFDTKALFLALRDKNFTAIRTWVTANLDNDSTQIYRQVYDALSDHLKPESVPQAIILLADYGDKNTRSADPEVCLLACLIEIMVNCEMI